MMRQQQQQQLNTYTQQQQQLMKEKEDIKKLQLDYKEKLEILNKKTRRVDLWAADVEKQTQELKEREDKLALLLLSSKNNKSSV